ncbi:MAG: AI-2E family transporter [Clostridia bacterium]|jgi:predicted PurR-regulated permease PerM|nr:AI-2E family transporter [Clostridia bacterium]MBQ6001168.1 AI-2E family transporter [Clostridia bacterium]
MARRRLNRGYLEISLYLALTVCIGITFTYLLFNSAGFFAGVAKVLRVVRPILVGFFLAYLLLPIVRRVRRHVVSKVAKNMSDRGQYIWSVFLTYVLFLALVYAFVYFLLPQIVNSLIDNVRNISKYSELIASKMMELDERYSISTLSGYTREEVRRWAAGLLGNGIQWINSRMPGLLAQAFSIANSMFNALISFVISIYVILDKDTFKGQFKRMLYALFRPETVENILRVIKDVDRMFGGFIAGKFIDSVIIGLLCFILMKFLRIPEATLVSTIVGVTNMIPTFGPFIGGVPCVILMIFVDYRAALTLAIMLVALQQFDGNILGPKILGDSLGISAFWVVFAVVFFGGVFGIWGMIFGVPTFAVIYKELGDLINYLLRKKQYPLSSEAYATGDFVPSPSEEQPQE